MQLYIPNLDEELTLERDCSLPIYNTILNTTFLARCLGLSRVKSKDKRDRIEEVLCQINGKKYDRRSNYGYRNWAELYNKLFLNLSLAKGDKFSVKTIDVRRYSGEGLVTLSFPKVKGESIYGRVWIKRKNLSNLYIENIQYEGSGAELLDKALEKPVEGIPEKSFIELCGSVGIHSSRSDANKPRTTTFKIWPDPDPKDEKLIMQVRDIEIDKAWNE